MPVISVWEWTCKVKNMSVQINGPLFETDLFECECSTFCYIQAADFWQLTKLSKLPEHIFENLKISWQNSAAAALKSTAETDIDIVEFTVRVW